MQKIPIFFTQQCADVCQSLQLAEPTPLADLMSLLWNKKHAFDLVWLAVWSNWGAWDYWNQVGNRRVFTEVLMWSSCWALSTQNLIVVGRFYLKRAHFTSHPFMLSRLICNDKDKALVVRFAKWSSPLLFFRIRLIWGVMLQQITWSLEIMKFGLQCQKHKWNGEDIAALV